MNKKIISILAAALMLGAIVAPASQAQTAGGGGVAFQGQADLPSFPCDPGPCLGDFNGTASGTASGVHNGTPWTVTFANTNMRAIDFAYREPVATCPATGTASGSFTLTGGTTVATYGTQTGTARASGTFTWERVGLAANIATRVTIFIKIGSAAEIAITLTDRAVAAFAPAGVVHCDAPGPLSAAVAGVDLLPDPLNP